MVHFMARDDAQLKIRLPGSLKERIAQRAQRFGHSMNAEIVGLIEEALSQFTYDISDTKSAPAQGRASDDDLEYEMRQLYARVDVIDEDFIELTERLAGVKDDVFTRQMLIKRISEQDAEREKLWERVKFLKQMLRRNRASAKNRDVTGPHDED